MDYKGYTIDTSCYGNLITVFYDGDDLVFNTVQEAKEFIDSLEA
jgi:hypothetical protein